MGASPETLMAETATIRPFSSMAQDVSLHTARHCEPSVAVRTLVLLFPRVQSHVVHQRVRVVKRLAADVAQVISLVFMD